MSNPTPHVLQIECLNNLLYSVFYTVLNIERTLISNTFRTIAVVRNTIMQLENHRDILMFLLK